MWRHWSQTSTEDLLENESIQVRCRNKPLPTACVTFWGQRQGTAKCLKWSGETWVLSANIGAVESWKKKWEWWHHPPSRVWRCPINVLPCTCCKDWKRILRIQARGAHTHFLSQVGKYCTNGGRKCYLISPISLPVFKEAPGELHLWILVKLSGWFWTH